MKNFILRVIASGVTLIFLLGIPAQAAVVNYNDLAVFQAAAGAMTLVNFDVDSDGNSIDASSPGVLAGTKFTGYGVTFNRGVVFRSLSFSLSSPNMISNTGINSGTGALVNGSFSSEVFEVGITNLGAGSVLRIFDQTDSLLGSISSDLDGSTVDFIGMISDTPIYRMEFDFSQGIGFAGDDLYFTQIVSPVPVPAAVWLFGTALIGLFGFGKRRKAA